MSCQVLSQFNRPIVYSLSPGTNVTPSMAKDVSGLVNMYRITKDDWDKWGDVKSHFDISRLLSFLDFISLFKILVSVLDSEYVAIMTTLLHYLCSVILPPIHHIT